MYTTFVESRTIHEFSTCISTQTLPMPYFSLLIRDVLHMDFFPEILSSDTYFTDFRETVEAYWTNENAPLLCTDTFFI